MKKPPVTLVAAAIVYLGYLCVQLASGAGPVVAGRLAVSVLLLFFVFRGSRVAGNLLAVLCTLSALVLLANAVAVLLAGAMVAAIKFAVIGVLLALFAGYLFFSPAMRVFQGKASAVLSR